MISLTLPFPPTTNNLFINQGRGRVKSPEYRQWSMKALAAIPDSARGRVTGQYHMSIVVERPDRRKRDITNLIKALEDCLAPVKLDRNIILPGVVRDDSDAEGVSIRWSARPPAKDARVYVSITPIPPAAEARAA